MVAFSSYSDSPSSRRSTSDKEVYATVSSSPPKRRAGRTKFQETRHPVYKGIRHRNAGKWVCEVREPNKKSRIWLGTFPTAEMAARAHDVAAMALRGRSACLNFSDSAFLPIPNSSCPRDIQRAAVEAAESFRPSSADHGRSISESEDRMDLGSAMGVLAGYHPFYVEDDIDFGMQGYFDMAEGLLIDPPPMTATPFAYGDLDCDVPLWSY